MTRHEQYDELLFQHELLRTRLRIREHYLGTVVKEVYENIGQVLSLIRIKLLGLHEEAGTGTREALDSSGELVGKTISDLRQMCRLFYPEEDILGGTGFHRVLAKETQSRFPGALYQADMDSPVPEILRGETGILVFGVLLELFAILDSGKQTKLTGVVVTADKAICRFVISYSGTLKQGELKKAGAARPGLALLQRVEMLGGSLSRKAGTNGNRKIILDLPINE